MVRVLMGRVQEQVSRDAVRVVPAVVSGVWVLGAIAFALSVAQGFRIRQGFRVILSAAQSAEPRWSENSRNGDRYRQRQRRYG